MIHRIGSQSIETLFSELYEKWPHCQFTFMYSDFDKELETDLNLKELLKKILSTKHQIQLGFYIKEMNGFLHKRKIDLIITEATFRYKLSGWGLIIFNIKNKNDSFEIECGVNSEKRATKWYGTSPELREPELWDWNVVHSTITSINRTIKKYRSCDT